MKSYTFVVRLDGFPATVGDDDKHMIRCLRLRIPKVMRNG